MKRNRAYINYGTLRKNYFVFQTPVITAYFSKFVYFSRKISRYSPPIVLISPNESFITRLNSYVHLLSPLEIQNIFEKVNLIIKFEATVQEFCYGWQLA